MGPTIVAAHAETEWPETLVLDSTDFWWANARTGTRRREFAILVAYGYTGPNAGHIWGIHASPTIQAHDWVQSMESLDLPGPLASVVAGDDLAIAAAVRRMWPPTPTPSLAQPFLLACEHHPARACEGGARGGQRARGPRARDTSAGPLSSAMRVGRSSTGPPASWAPRPRGAPTNDALLRLQTSVRHLLPAHYSTAGAEAAAHRLRNLYEQRSFSLRNASRTNLLLGLTRLQLNNRDDVNAYHRVLRQAAESGQGRPRRGQRLNRDQLDANGDPQPSLR